MEGDNKKDTAQGKEKVVKSRKGGNVKQQTIYGNCDVSTISQGSKPRVEVTSVNLNKSITMVSETALQPLTPTLKSSSESPIRNLYKVTDNGSYKEENGEKCEIKAKSNKHYPCQLSLKDKFQAQWNKTSQEKLESSAMHNWSFYQTTSRRSSN